MTDHSDWEFFQDEGYFGMWCVREKGVRRFGEGFHTVSKEEAEALASALSSQSLSLSEAREEIERLRGAFAASNDDICQTLGKALGYPWFKDDQKNFPGATEANGVCVGDHVAESIAAEAANRFDALKADMAVVLRAELDRLEAAAPLNARETARYLMVERRLSALENGPAVLADATSNPPLSDLSSLRKGAEVMREAIEDAVEKLNTYRGAAVQTVIDQLEAALVSGSREDGADA